MKGKENAGHLKGAVRDDELLTFIRNNYECCQHVRCEGHTSTCVIQRGGSV